MCIRCHVTLDTVKFVDLWQPAAPPEWLTVDWPDMRGMVGQNGGRVGRRRVTDKRRSLQSQASPLLSHSIHGIVGNSTSPHWLDRCSSGFWVCEGYMPGERFVALTRPQNPLTALIPSLRPPFSFRPPASSTICIFDIPKEKGSGFSHPFG